MLKSSKNLRDGTLTVEQQIAQVRYIPKNNDTTAYQAKSVKMDKPMAASESNVAIDIE